MTQPDDKPEAEVLSKDAGGRTRNHFAGLLRDAKTFVENNFPRVHVEPGSNQAVKADVYVRTRDGKTTAFHGVDSGGEDGWHDVDDNGNVVEDTAESTATVEPPSTEPPVETAGTGVPPSFSSGV